MSFSVNSKQWVRREPGTNNLIISKHLATALTLVGGESVGFYVCKSSKTLYIAFLDCAEIESKYTVVVKNCKYSMLMPEPVRSALFVIYDRLPATILEDGYCSCDYSGAVRNPGVYSGA